LTLVVLSISKYVICQCCWQGDSDSVVRMRKRFQTYKVRHDEKCICFNELQAKAEILVTKEAVYT